MATSIDRDWVLPYLDFMVAENFEEGLDLKAQYFPQSIYRYRRLNPNTIKSLTNNNIWLAEVSSLNDPFEGALQFDNNACLRLWFSSKEFRESFIQNFGIWFTDTELEKIIKGNNPYTSYLETCHLKGIHLNLSSEQQAVKAQRRWEEIINAESRNVKVACFSEQNDSIPMWTHYADEHKGICIEYDFANEDRGEIRAFLSPVLYSNEVYKVNVFEDFTTTRLIRALLTKSIYWEYEAEWRLTIMKKRNRVFPETIAAPIPKAIYFGTRFNQNNDKEIVAQLMQVIKGMNIPFHEMVKHPTEYRLLKK